MLPQTDRQTDRQTDSVNICRSHTCTDMWMCMCCRKIHRNRLYTGNYTACYKLLRMYRCQHRSPAKEF